MCESKTSAMDLTARLILKGLSQTVETSKIHRKSYKNRKNANSILLVSL
jgi:hypothetical protein